MLLVLTYKLFWNVAIVYGDGGSGLKNETRTIIKNVSVFCNEDHLWTIKRKSCSWKRKENICIAWIFSWYMHWNIIQIIIRCFGAVSSSKGSTTNIDGNEYFGLEKIQCWLFVKSGLMRKQKYAFFYFRQISSVSWWKNFTFMSVLFLKYTYYFAKVF